MIIFYPLVWLLQYLRPWIVDASLTLSNQDVQLISAFHMCAKLIGVICFYPLIDWFKHQIEYFLPVTDNHLQLHIESRNDSLSAVIKKELLDKDIKNLWHTSLQSLENLLKYPQQHDHSTTDVLLKDASKLIKASTELQ